MPIILDTENKDIDKQLKDINKTININKSVDAKYFSKSLTGSGNRKTGVFPIQGDTIDEFVENRRRLLENVNTNHGHNISKIAMKDQVLGNKFYRETKHTHKDFKQFEVNLTTMLPPIMFTHALSGAEGAAISMPRNTGMYNMNAMESNWEVLVEGTIDGQPATTYVKPIIQAISLYSKTNEHTSPSGHTSKTNVIAGQPEIYIAYATVLNDMDKNGDMIFTDAARPKAKTLDSTQGVVTISPLRERSRLSYSYDKVVENIDIHIKSAIGNNDVKMKTPSTQKTADVLGKMSMSKLLKDQANTVSNQAGEAMLTFIRTFTKRLSEFEKKIDDYGNTHKNIMDALVLYVQHIDILNDVEDNLIPTDMLAEIYSVIKDTVKDQTTVQKLVKHSLRLLLSKRLSELDDIRKSGGLYEFKPDNKNVRDAMLNSKDYSGPQKKIIGSTDPLVIGQAGAGSGKSHTLVGRISYMRDQGEDLKKALVLSFTNVSAININNRFPDIRSETLANMFHTIYSATYPAQKLSQPSTVANSIRLLNPSSNYFVNQNLDPTALKNFMEAFAKRLEQFDQTGFKRVNLQLELKHLSNLIEDNLDMAIALLDAVEQTTLEIEPIIIHHKLMKDHNSLNIPQEYRDLNYIITDESQDISTFEYILLLELTIHYRSQLLIIGDGSQTLYEFRNSDPRYMNALESSNVFTSHKLETNYRSNEEILMFANQFLQVIDANKYAGIQLKSSKFRTPTPDSVMDMVKVRNNPMQSASTVEYTNAVTEFIEEDNEFQEWFLERVRKGEQVALMGWTRKEVTKAGEKIEQLLAENNLGHIEITNIMSNNEPPMTILSRFAHSKGTSIRSIDPTLPGYTNEIEKLARDFIRIKFNRGSDKQRAFFKDTIMRGVGEVTASGAWRAWIQDHKNNQATDHMVGSFLIQSLLRIETRRNAMDQYLRKQKDIPNYDKCPIILSTIHGTKGLEFEHTVVLFNESKPSATSQEALRMMFVALSRAKKSEFIINSHKETNKRSEGDTLASMFQTPMPSALLRTINDAEALQQPAGVAAGTSNDA